MLQMLNYLHNMILYDSMFDVLRNKFSSLVYTDYYQIHLVNNEFIESI